MDEMERRAYVAGMLKAREEAGVLDDFGDAREAAYEMDEQTEAAHLGYQAWVDAGRTEDPFGYEIPQGKLTALRLAAQKAVGQ